MSLEEIINTSVGALNIKKYISVWKFIIFNKNYAKRFRFYKAISLHPKRCYMLLDTTTVNLKQKINIWTEYDSRKEN